MAFSIRFDLRLTAGRRAADESRDQHRCPRPRPTGLALGVAAYGLWGVLPVYFKALRSVDRCDIVAHRIVWSVPVLAALLSVSGAWGEVREALRNRRVVLLLTVTALLIAGNWLLYVYAVNSGHILAGSLGYYLNPLANVLLGRIVLKERLSWLQWAAVALAAAGISALAVGCARPVWISLILCVSFATYGLLRKIAPVDAVAGLAIETAILFPFAAGWLIWGLAAGTPIFGTSQLHVVLIAFAGIVTARRCCCSRRPPSGCATRRWECCNSLRQRSSSCSRSRSTESRSRPRMRSHSARSGERSLSTSSPSSPCASVRRLAAE